MLGGGCFRGSSIVVSGPAGTGKTSLAASFAQAACRSGDRCLFLAYEESPRQLMRNMRSIGIDLATLEQKGTLRLEARRVTSQGIETHLVQVHKAVDLLDPALVVIDPISTFHGAASAGEVASLIVRMIDFLKSRGITALLTHMTGGDTSGQSPESGGMFSLMDTWIVMQDIQRADRRERSLMILKSRGTDHEDRPRTFTLTSKGFLFESKKSGERSRSLAATR
jgi:circadian clock protein KaiC